MVENNEVDYRDDTPLSQADIDDVNKLVEKDEYSTAGKKIANWLKTKKYGKPTRGAMSLWASIIGDSTEKNYKIARDSAAKVDNIGERFDDQIAGSTNDNEMIDLRHSDMLKKSFTTARKRGDFWDNEFRFRGVNVRWFGAVGDGVTDDTQAFQAALDYGADKTDFLYIPIGTYAISGKLVLNKSIKAERGAKLLCVKQGRDYMFSTANAELTSLIVSGLTVDMQDGRGVFYCNDLDYAEFRDCDISGYSAEYGYYQTDSGIMLNNVEETYIKDVRIHDHGDQYNSAIETLNRCITLQGNNKLAKFDNLKIERANEGVVIKCPALTVSINDSLFSETHDNSIYALNVDFLTTSHTIFNEKFDESVVIGNGTYSFNDCTFKDSPGRTFGINADTQMLNIQDCNFLNSAGFGGNPISFRNITYRINSLLFKNNKLNLYPSDSSSDIFTLGQLDYFDISGNLFKISSLGEGQRLLAFRNTQNVLLRGKISKNVVSPLATSDTISGKYYFAGFFKDNNNVYINGNDTAGGRITLNRGGIVCNNQSAQVNIGPYATGMVNSKTNIYSDSMPATGTWTVGDIVWNILPTKDTNIICWFRISNGNGNARGTDWLAVKGD